MKNSKGITLIALVITIVLNACGMVGRNDYSTGFFL